MGIRPPLRFRTERSAVGPETREFAPNAVVALPPLRFSVRDDVSDHFIGNGAFRSRRRLCVGRTASFEKPRTDEGRQKDDQFMEFLGRHPYPLGGFGKIVGTGCISLDHPVKVGDGRTDLVDPLRLLLGGSSDFAD